uniref:Guanine nucleotide-binding protein subunit gamma n=2 Tax=Passeriformes TaxID=9126 RepID=A0A674HJY6_TAEGU
GREGVKTPKNLGGRAFAVKFGVWGLKFGDFGAEEGILGGEELGVEIWGGEHEFGNNFAGGGHGFGGNLGFFQEDLGWKCRLHWGFGFFSVFSFFVGFKIFFRFILKFFFFGGGVVFGIFWGGSQILVRGDNLGLWGRIFYYYFYFLEGKYHIYEGFFRWFFFYFWVGFLWGFCIFLEGFFFGGIPKFWGAPTAPPMKGEPPPSSTLSVGQARKMVEQLKTPSPFLPSQVSKAAAELLSYCEAHACEDPLLTPVPTSENPFREKKFFCALL